MKFIKILFIPLILALVLSCGRDEDLGPIITIDNAEICAFPRLVNLITGEYDLANIGTSAYSHEVEFQSQNAGANVQSYEIFASFNGGDEVLFQSFGQGDFGTSELGLRNITVSFPFTEVAAALGIAANDVLAGDQFEFRSVLNLDDGRQFTGDASSTESTLLSSAFRGYFDWVVKATCPISDDVFSGEYMLTIDGPTGLGYGPGYSDQVVTIVPVPGSSTLRSFSTLVLEAIGGFGPYDTIFDIVCDQAVYQLMDTGSLGCGGGGIQFGPARDASGAVITEPLDLNDDSQIVLFFNEGFANGGCPGQTGETMTRMVLTKM